MPANEYMISQGKKVVALPYYSAQSSSNIKESIINTKIDSSCLSISKTNRNITQRMGKCYDHCKKYSNKLLSWNWSSF